MMGKFEASACIFIADSFLCAHTRASVKETVDVLVCDALLAEVERSVPM